MLKKLKFITRDYVGERDRQLDKGLPLAGVSLSVPLPHFDVK